ncbi:MAG: hypothetical protein PHR71_05490 [Polaromonas sp.]|nr:hypothetical protein [Polaromonas sp.]
MLDNRIQTNNNYNWGRVNPVSRQGIHFWAEKLRVFSASIAKGASPPRAGDQRHIANSMSGSFGRAGAVEIRCIGAAAESWRTRRRRGWLALWLGAQKEDRPMT